MTTPRRPDTTDPDRLRRWARGPLRWLGVILSLAGAGWVVLVLARHGEQLGDALAGGRTWAEIGLGTAGYAALSLLAAATWWWALGLYGDRPGFAAGWAIWARSQAAKYLPGNVFHYVGRQVLGRRVGLGHVALGAAAVVELISILAASALLAGLAVWISLAAARSGSGSAGLGSASLGSGAAWTLGLAVAGLAGVLLADALARRLPRLALVTADLPPLTRGRMVGVMLPSLAVHAVYLAACSLLVWRLAAALAGDGPPVEAWTVLSAYPIAWAAGTVTPGAPGGLGVREAALAIQLAPALGEPAAALVALAFRGVTVAGDLLVTGLGWVLRPSR